MWIIHNVLFQAPRHYKQLWKVVTEFYGGENHAQNPLCQTNQWIPEDELSLPYCVSWIHVPTTNQRRERFFTTSNHNFSNSRKKHNNKMIFFSTINSIFLGTIDVTHFLWKGPKWMMWAHVTTVLSLPSWLSSCSLSCSSSSVVSSSCCKNERGGCPWRCSFVGVRPFWLLFFGGHLIGEELAGWLCPRCLRSAEAWRGGCAWTMWTDYTQVLADHWGHSSCYLFSSNGSFYQWEDGNIRSSDKHLHDWGDIFSMIL